MKDNVLSNSPTVYSFNSPYLFCMKDNLIPSVIFPEAISNEHESNSIYIDRSPIPIGRFGYSLTAIDDRLVMIGGKYSVTVLGPNKDRGNIVRSDDLVWVFELKKKVWRLIPTLMLYNREESPMLHHHFSCHYKNGSTNSLICIGGFNNGVVSRDVWVLTIVGRDCFTWKRLETIGREQPQFSTLQTYHGDVFKPESGKVTVHKDTLWVMTKQSSAQFPEIHYLDLVRRVWRKLNLDLNPCSLSLPLEAYVLISNVPPFNSKSNDSLSHEEHVNCNNIPNCVLKAFEDSSYQCLLFRNFQLTKRINTLESDVQKFHKQVNQANEREKIAFEEFQTTLQTERLEHKQVIESLQKELDMYKKVIRMQNGIPNYEVKINEMQEDIKQLKEVLQTDKDSKINHLHKQLENITQESNDLKLQLKEEKERNSKISLEIEYNITKSLFERTKLLCKELEFETNNLEESLHSRKQP